MELTWYNQRPMVMIHMLPIRSIAISFLLASLASNTSAQVSDHDAATKVERFLEADFDDKRSAFEQIAGKQSLAELKQHENPTVAIHAAWIEALKSRSGKDEKQLIVPTDRIATSRFFGFLEGRTRIDLPKWWTTRMSPSELEKKMIKRILRRKTKKAHPMIFEYGRTGFKNIHAPTNAAMEMDDGSTAICIGEDEIVVPKSIEEVLGDGDYWRISGCFSETTFFLAVHNAFGTPHDLYAISRQSGEIVWKSVVYGCMWSGGTTGHHECHVELTIRNDRLVVFGAARTGFYAGAFSASEGEELFQFSTEINLDN